MKKVSLLGVEIKTNNQREEKLVRIARSMCYEILEWVDEEYHNEVVDTISMTDRRQIARRNTEDICGLFRAMYFMDMIKQPQYFNLEDLEAWNGED